MSGTRRAFSAGRRQPSQQEETAGGYDRNKLAGAINEILAEPHYVLALAWITINFYSP
jgi:hypothetical protein